MKYNACFYSIGLAVFLVSMTSYALPFTIIPQGNLPTSVSRGGSDIGADFWTKKVIF